MTAHSLYRIVVLAMLTLPLGLLGCVVVIQAPPAPTAPPSSTARPTATQAMLGTVLPPRTAIVAPSSTLAPTATMPPSLTALPTATARPSAPPSPSSTPLQTPVASDSRTKEIVQYMLDMIVANRTSDWAIAQLDIAGGDVRSMMPRNENTMRQCWLYEGGQTKSIPCQTMLDLAKQELNTPKWKHGYADFSIVSVTSDYAHALIRYDAAAGPMMGSGELITLVKKDGKWQVESRQGVWIS